MNNSNYSTNTHPNEEYFEDNIEHVFSRTRDRKAIQEVKYFHPSGRSLPNGSNIQRGGFLNECRQNKDAYIIDEAVHGKRYELAKYKGGIITFSTNIDKPHLLPDTIADKIKQIVGAFNRQNPLNFIEECIGAYSVGRFFHGRYIGENGEVYDENSLSVDVAGLGSISLVTFARCLAEILHQETALIKDLNTGKILLLTQK